MAEPFAFELMNVTKRYRRVEALRNFSAGGRAGRVIGLLGANGAGKSTLLRLVAGVAHPSAGQVQVFGRPVSEATLSQVAFCPEEDHLYASMAVDEITRFFAAVFPGFSVAVAERLREMLHVPADSKVGHLSRGMRARFKLALAFARQAPLVLLDEPFSGIDIASRARITEALLQYERPEGTTVVLSTHQVGEVELLLDDVMIVSKGEVMYNGEAEALRATRGKSIEAVLREVE